MIKSEVGFPNVPNHMIVDDSFAVAIWHRHATYLLSLGLIPEQKFPVVGLNIHKFVTIWDI